MDRKNAQTSSFDAVEAEKPSVSSLTEGLRRAARGVGEVTEDEEEVGEGDFSLEEDEAEEDAEVLLFNSSCSLFAKNLLIS